MSTIRAFSDPLGTTVFWDDDVAVEVPDRLNLGKVLDLAGWFSRTGVTPESLGIEVTIFAEGDHPQFVTKPGDAENKWAYVQTVGATGKAGLDADVLLAAVFAAIEFDASAK